MTNIAMENHHAIKNGKPSISIRAIYTMANCWITRGYIVQSFFWMHHWIHQPQPLQRAILAGAAGSGGGPSSRG